MACSLRNSVISTQEVLSQSAASRLQMPFTARWLGTTTVNAEVVFRPCCGAGRLHNDAALLPNIGAEMVIKNGGGGERGKFS